MGLRKIKEKTMNYWLAVGSPQNWNTAFEHGNIWGLKETQRHLWESLNEDDILLFYATNPVGGLIGYGPVRTKFKQSKPLWPDELKKYEASISTATLEKIYHLGELTQTIFQKAVDCVFTRDLKIANSLLEMHDVLESEFEQEMHGLPEIPYLRTIVSNLSKIADKGALIAKLAINTTLMKSDKEIGKILKIKKHTRTIPLPAKRE